MKKFISVDELFSAIAKRAATGDVEIADDQLEDMGAAFMALKTIEASFQDGMPEYIKNSNLGFLVEIDVDSVSGANAPA